MPRKPTEQELEETVQQEEERIEEKVAQAGEEAKTKAEDKGLSQEEVNKQVEAARKEEKDKLYPKLDELKAAISDLQKKIKAEQDEKDKVKKEAEQQAEQERLSKLSSEEKQNEVLQRIEEQLQEERKQRVASEERFAQEKRASELREYRKNAIQAVLEKGEQLLPELVTGDSEEEIDASISRSKARYVELYEQMKAELGADTKKHMPRPTSPSMEALDEQELSEQLTEIDPTRYRTDAEYREKVKQELASVYARSAGM